MAAIIEIISQPGQDLYAVVHDSTGKIANGSTTEVFNGSNWATYVIAVTEEGATGYYKGVFPAYLLIGKYTIVMYLSGGTPTLGDICIGSSSMYFDGTIEEQGVLAQIRAALSSDPIPELIGIPSATPTFAQALMIMFMSLRNAHTATASDEKIKNSAGSTITAAPLSDDGTTFTKGKFT